MDSFEPRNSLYAKHEKCWYSGLRGSKNIVTAGHLILSLRSVLRCNLPVQLNTLETMILQKQTRLALLGRTPPSSALQNSLFWEEDLWQKTESGVVAFDKGHSKTHYRPSSLVRRSTRSTSESTRHTSTRSATRKHTG